MTDTRRVVEQHWSTANARDWPGFAALLHPDLVYEVPQTRERVRGAAAYLEFFRTWPGDWRADVKALIVEGEQAVSTIDFAVDGETMTGISFFKLKGGSILHITDFWPSAYEPPARMTSLIERH
ncbi:MAG: nuclear transport factor 2 family protein [Chitinophagaceae bacterium]|nr:nuclear transport factor 2 family protein [Rubrivivax sp.]